MDIIAGARPQTGGEHKFRTRMNLFPERSGSNSTTEFTSTTEFFPRATCFEQPGGHSQSSRLESLAAFEALRLDEFRSHKRAGITGVSERNPTTKPGIRLGVQSRNPRLQTVVQCL